VYLLNALKIETQIAAYSLAMPPISIADLKPAFNDDADSDDEGLGQVCNPPMTRVPRSRLRKVRKDKGNYRATRGVGAADLVEGDRGQREKRTVICSTCGEDGHYSTTCRLAHN
jgi:hypothetical protein